MSTQHRRHTHTLSATICRPLHSPNNQLAYHYSCPLLTSLGPACHAKQTTGTQLYKVALLQHQSINHTTVHGSQVCHQAGAGVVSSRN